MLLNRGNHEERSVHSMYGFMQEVTQKYDKEIYDAFNEFAPGKTSAKREGGVRGSVRALKDIRSDPPRVVEDDELGTGYAQISSSNESISGLKIAAELLQISDLLLGKNLLVQELNIRGDKTAKQLDANASREEL